MPGFLSGGLTVLIRGEARMLSASIREIHSFIHFILPLTRNTTTVLYTEIH